MRWRLLYQVRKTSEEGLWLLPVCGSLIGAVVGRLITDVDDPSWIFHYGSSASTSLLAGTGSAMIALTGFVITVSVLIVQTSTGSFSARYMRVWYQDRILKLVLAVLIGTLTYSFVVLRDVRQNDVPDVATTLIVPLASFAVILFLVFLDRALRRLRPVAVAHSVAAVARKTIDRMAESPPVREGPGEPYRQTLLGEPGLTCHSRHAGVIQALHLRGLTIWAQRHNCTLVFRHGLGDFVPSGSEVVSVFGENPPAGSELQILDMIVLGREGTNEQDLSFSIRIMVDIANKALSPGINDPTTASQALNYLEDTLALLGGVPHLDGTLERVDGEGKTRLILPMQRWDDFLALGVTEIREYGATSIQVMRRLRALLEKLLEVVRPEYRPAVLDQLTRLDATVSEAWKASVDFDLARTADRRALGGSAADRPARSDAITRTS
jgi:uncharacterized membrane protein